MSCSHRRYVYGVHRRPMYSCRPAVPWVCSLLYTLRTVYISVWVHPCCYASSKCITARIIGPEGCLQAVVEFIGLFKLLIQVDKLWRCCVACVVSSLVVAWEVTSSKLSYIRRSAMSCFQYLQRNVWTALSEVGSQHLKFREMGLKYTSARVSTYEQPRRGSDILLKVRLI